MHNRDAKYFVTDLLTRNWPVKYVILLFYLNTRLVKRQQISDLCYT